MHLFFIIKKNVFSKCPLNFSLQDDIIQHQLAWLKYLYAKIYKGHIISCSFVGFVHCQSFLSINSCCYALKTHLEDYQNVFDVYIAEASREN